jgi:hypothetical protein
MFIMYSKKFLGLYLKKKSSCILKKCSLCVKKWSPCILKNIQCVFQKWTCICKEIQLYRGIGLGTSCVPRVDMQLGHELHVWLGHATRSGEFTCWGRTWD